MSEDINMSVIIYKAQLFGINAKLISHLLNSDLVFCFEMKNKLINVVDAIYSIEKSSQLSLS